MAARITAIATIGARLLSAWIAGAAWAATVATPAAPTATAREMGATGAAGWALAELLLALRVGLVAGTAARRGNPTDI